MLKNSAKKETVTALWLRKVYSHREMRQRRDNKSAEEEEESRYLRVWFPSKKDLSEKVESVLVNGYKPS